MQLRCALVAFEIESPIRRDFLVGQSGSGLADLKRVFARGDESVH